MTGDPIGTCGCGRILYESLNREGKRTGVTHLTCEDEDHHLEYFGGMRVRIVPGVDERDRNEPSENLAN